MNFKMFFQIYKVKIITSICIILAIYGILLFIMNQNNIINLPFIPSRKIPYSSITSSDNAFKLTFDSSYGLKNIKTNSYIINLINSDNFSFLVSSIPKYNFKLKEILESDKQTFLKSFKNYTQITNVKEEKHNNISGYSYFIIYSENSIEYKLIEFITEIDNTLYFFDIQFPLKQERKYQTIANELLNSLTIIK